MTSQKKSEKASRAGMLNGKTPSSAGSVLLPPHPGLLGWAASLLSIGDPVPSLRVILESGSISYMLSDFRETYYVYQPLTVHPGPTTSFYRASRKETL